MPDKPQGQVQLVASSLLPSNALQVAGTTQKADACLIPASSRPSLGQDYTDTSPAMIAGLKTAGADTTLSTDQWGTWISGYAPIYNSKGQAVGAVGVDMCAMQVEELQHTILRSTSTALGLTLLVLILAVGLIATDATRPIMELTRVAGLIGAGAYNQDFSHFYSTRIPDEVDKLASVLELMAGKVYEREQNLKARVQQLEIIIDQPKLDQQVSEIVDSDFFQDLQSKVKDMRSRFKNQSDSEG